MPQSEGGDSGGRWIASPEDGVKDTQPLVPQERHGAHPDRVVKGSMQRSAGNVESLAELGHMDRPFARNAYVVLNLLHDSQC